ncbi:kelch-like protein 12 isoform X2 [Entelurus aequoreus]|nr:kelch-like protein 12 isoform X2 [Entelurus aequoreus]
MAPKEIMTNSHAKSILNAMNSLRKSNTLCDITLRVENAHFPAHRIVLAACSDYFCAMFTSELSEKGKSFVDIQGLTASTMEILLDFVYTETVLVTVENVQELLPAACLLQLKGVKRACCEFLESQLDPSNCLGIRDFADTHNCLDLMQAAELFSQKHFSEVVQHEEFMLLSQTEVEKLIKCDEIQVDSEEPVFEAVLNWVKHNRKEREPHLPDMLVFVRMPLLTPRYITDVIDAEPLVRSSLPCRDLVDEAKKFHLRPELRSEMQGPRTQARLGAKEILLVIGGFGSQQSPIDIVEKYDPKTQEWSFLPNIARKRRYVATVSLHDRVYVIGGYDGRSRLSSVECLDYTADEDGVWYTVATMNVRRGLAGATTLGDMIYVAGGFDGSRRHTSMERYDPNIDQWSMLGDMQTAREGAGLVVASGLIYCLGGYDGLNILNSVERYDPHTGHWTSVTPMATKRSGAGVALLNDHIYVVGGFDGVSHLDSVEVYNIRTDYWTTVTSMTTPRCYVGATVLRGRLYAIAGTETALVRVTNDLLMAADAGSPSLLILLDLTAAFDTVDHNILISRLQSTIGLNNTALQWFKSYISGRSEYVSLGGSHSRTLPVTCGVPQGSVLGPTLFTLYLLPLGRIISRHGISFHCYADDTQLYLQTMQTSPSFPTPLSILTTCLEEIKAWMSINFLQLNSSKTVVMKIGTPHQINTCPITSITFSGQDLPLSPVVTNLGVKMDPHLNFEAHINYLRKTSFFHLRNISRLRPSLRPATLPSCDQPGSENGPPPEL